MFIFMFFIIFTYKSRTSLVILIAYHDNNCNLIINLTLFKNLLIAINKKVELRVYNNLENQTSEFLFTYNGESSEHEFRISETKNLRKVLNSRESSHSLKFSPLISSSPY